ncbi:MAG: hypothetical protein IID45_13670 [Planctomycetes bacterium]|nr:hypothetical protein [Planctomycetota bacterium]
MSSPSSTNESSADAPIEFDPIFLNSRREAIVIFCLWLTALVWAVPFCYLNGYIDDYDPQTFSTTWGIPTWLFWGILVPWIIADIFTTWFCFCYMKDDDVSAAHEGSDVEEKIAEIHAGDVDSGKETSR